MVNASLNWASITGLGLILFWIPLYLISLIHVDWLTRRQIERSKRAPEWIVFVVTFCGRAFCLPFVAGILFFQGWRLDPILQFGVFLIAAGVIAEASTSALNVDEQNRQFAAAHRSDTDHSRPSAMALRVQDRVWLWAVLHATLPLVSFYYAFTRRTITPFLWDILVRIVVVLLSNGLVYLLVVLAGGWLPASALSNANPWLIVAFAFVLLVLNWLLAVLAARHGIMKAKSFARLKLGMQS